MKLKPEIVTLLVVGAVLATFASLIIRWQNIVNDRNYDCLQNQTAVIEIMRKNPDVRPIIPTCYL